MSGDGARSGRESMPDKSSGDDLSKRLDRLGEKLEARRQASVPEKSRDISSTDPSALSKALRVSSEFIAGVIVGGGIGWAFDKGLGTSPWGLIVFLLVGFAAGVYNVIRSAGTSAGR